MDEESRIRTEPLPPFLSLKRALEETFGEIRRSFAKKRDDGIKFPVTAILRETQTCFRVVFEANKRYFHEEQQAELELLEGRISASICDVETLIQAASRWLPSAAHDERFALDHVKLNLDAILADAQPQFT